MTEEDIQGQTLVFTHICVRMHNQIEEQQKKVEEERGGKRERRRIRMEESQSFPGKCSWHSCPKIYAGYSQYHGPTVIKRLTAGAALARSFSL